MNSKKNKNKNRGHKPPNPNPPQKVEEPVPVDVVSDEKKDVLDEGKVEIPVKLEERVPEIVSETVPLVEADDKDESPKKPKRNRGKKKKQDKDIESHEEKEREEEPIVENVEVVTETVTSTQEVAPSSRKKKNKNKKVSEEIENKTPEPVMEAVPVTEDTKTESNLCDLLTETPRPGSASEQDTKSKKKNKKKRNRNDSEKSDKNEELACVSGFQNLLPDKTSETTTLIPEKSETQTKPLPECVQNITIEKIAPVSQSLEPLLENISEDTMKQPENVTKNKKKNKKEKKNVPTGDSELRSDINVDKKVDVKSAAADVEMLEVITKEVKPQTSQTVTDVIVTSDDSSQVKAKIVKPVDRTRKGETQENKELKESLIQSQIDVSKDLEPKFLPEQQPARQLEGDNTTQNKAVVEKETVTKTNIFEETKKLVTETTDVDNTKTLDFPSPEGAMGKKRKKSPKPAKSEEKSEKVEMNKPLDTEINLLPSVIPLGMSTEMKEEISKPQSESTAKQEFIEKEHKTNESKSKKKGKKIPNIPTDNTTKTENIKFADDTPSISSKTETIISTEKKEVEAQKTQQSVIVSDVPSDDDIQITSLVADDLEETISAVSPDIIQHPLATSQDNLDSNNNPTIIQEIPVSEDIKFDIPISLSDIPLIQGSGETPILTPDLSFLSGLTTEKVKKQKKASQEEKTDLKSKVMEVNQDMEELRLSIERSLAELTAIENIEEESDRKFTDTVLHITEEPELTDVKKIQKDKKKLPTETPETSVTPEKAKEEKTKIDKPIALSELLPGITEPAILMAETVATIPTPPPFPPRKDHKNKGKSKKKGRPETSAAQSENVPTSESTESKPQETESQREHKGEQKSVKKPDTKEEKGKQQADIPEDLKNKEESTQPTDYQPIENFEDAMTSSADDINRTFEIIANEAHEAIEASHVNPEINITAPIEDIQPKVKDEKVNPVSQPKNLLGHTDIPVPSNRIDYKKEKNKTPNETFAKVKIKDGIYVEEKKQSKESQTDNIKKFMQKKSIDESLSIVTNENEDFVYRYSFRKVFLQTNCHVCKKGLKQARVPCGYCNLVFYCSAKHKDEDWPSHQALCFAVSTIGHLKGEKHIYADSKNVIGHSYRLLRMQMIVSCEKIVKRKLVPWEQEALLYPRLCADPGCREWWQAKLMDCEVCGQISFCIEHPDHLPKTHQRWCKSYLLYQKLVCYQQTKGRLEPKMPSKVMVDYEIPENMNEVLASMYEEKIDMNDIEYAALTQIATAPLTAAYCYQEYTKAHKPPNGLNKKYSYTIHVVGAELQFEADALNKWEVFFLHLAPRVQELKVVLIAAELNPSNLPLELLSNVRACDNCRKEKRRVLFNFQDKKAYHEYYRSEEYTTPNLVCAFNAGINRSSLYSHKDSWPATINSILKLRIPFVITSHTMNEIQRDLVRVKECAEYKYNLIILPKVNSFASVRPDRNFISDDEMPLLFKNYTFSLLCGVY